MRCGQTLAQMIKIKFNSFILTRSQIISAAMKLYFPDDTVVIIHQPSKHADYIRDYISVEDSVITGADYTLLDLLVLKIETEAFARAYCKFIPFDTGPFAEVYSRGEFVTDNIGITEEFVNSVFKNEGEMVPEEVNEEDDDDWTFGVE